MRTPAAAKQAKAPVQRGRVKGALVVPEYTLKLMEHVGPTAAAKLLGTTPGTLHKARNANLVTQVFEVAARGVWHEQGYAEMEAARAAPPGPRTSDLAAAVHAPTSEETVLMLVQVPRGREAIIQKTAEAVGGTVAVQA